MATAFECATCGKALSELQAVTAAEDPGDVQCVDCVLAAYDRDALPDGCRVEVSASLLHRLAIGVLYAGPRPRPLGGGPRRGPRPSPLDDDPRGEPPFGSGSWDEYLDVTEGNRRSP